MNRNGERGAVSTFLAVLALALLMAAGLGIYGGRKVNLLREASHLASRLLRCARTSEEAWRLADAYGEEVAAHFWREFSYFGLGPEFPGAGEVASRLRGVGRFAASLDLLAIYAPKEAGLDFAESIAQGFEGLMSSEVEDPECVWMVHGLEPLLKVLADHREALGSTRVLHIEWFFLPALGYDPQAPTLHSALAEDPGWFVDIVTLRYRPATSGEAGEERETESEQHKQLASNAYRLLSSWSTCPGTGADGSVDPKALRSWVSEARRRLAEADRVEVGDQEIGKALSAAPAGGDGLRPGETVRNLLEELELPAIDTYLGIVYTRGASTRGLYSGGGAEWKLAEEYRGYARQLSRQWPRTSTIMARVAESYEAQARRWDNEAELRRRGLG